MKKPLLLVVTGMPASGKTTLSHLIAREIRCPLLSRDELKEGFINTLGVSHSQADSSVAMHIYETFFEAIEFLISRKISIIVEAAFQDKLWKPKLLELTGKAEIKVVICKTNIDLINERFSDRLLKDHDREKFHGDSLLISTKEKSELLTEKYAPVKIDVPTLEVDTTNNYKPGLEEITRFILTKS